MQLDCSWMSAMPAWQWSSEGPHLALQHGVDAAQLHDQCLALLFQLRYVHPLIAADTRLQ